MIEEFKNKVKEYQARFGLQNWSIIIQESPIDQDLRNAKTLADPRYYRAIMTVYPILLNNKEIWDEIVIHELIHIVMAQYDFYVDNYIEFSKIPENLSQELYFNEREATVSQLTSIIMRIYGK